jgi:hypothetical protein
MSVDKLSKLLLTTESRNLPCPLPAFLSLHGIRMLDLHIRRDKVKRLPFGVCSRRLVQLNAREPSELAQQLDSVQYLDSVEQGHHRATCF